MNANTCGSLFQTVGKANTGACFVVVLVCLLAFS